MVFWWHHSRLEKDLPNSNYRNIHLFPLRRICCHKVRHANIHWVLEDLCNKVVSNNRILHKENEVETILTSLQRIQHFISCTCLWVDRLCNRFLDVGNSVHGALHAMKNSGLGDLGHSSRRGFGFVANRWWGGLYSHLACWLFTFQGVEFLAGRLRGSYGGRCTHGMAGWQQLSASIDKSVFSFARWWDWGTHCWVLALNVHRVLDDSFAITIDITHISNSTCFAASHSLLWYRENIYLNYSS